jgi:capsular polysaccharide biosynthesis protein
MTKLLIRRWYFSLPLLLVCLTLVAVASVTVKPDYSAVGHIQLIPPTASTDAKGDPIPIKNPWFDLGYQAMGNAAIIDVTKKAVFEQMIADGMTDNITITPIDQVPLFEIEAVGTTPQQATATVQRVQQNFNKAVLQRQDSMRVTKSDEMTTLALDDGTEVTVKRSKTLRVMVVAAGVGLLLTAGLTIGLDAILRARTRRRLEAEGLVADEQVVPATGYARANGDASGAGRGMTKQPSVDATQIVVVPQRIPPAAPRVPHTNGTNGVPARSTNIGSEASGASGRPRSPGGTEYRSKQSDAKRPETGPDDSSRLESTVVLSPAQRRGEKKGDGR